MRVANLTMCLRVSPLLQSRLFRVNTSLKYFYHIVAQTIVAIENVKPLDNLKEECFQE